MDYSDRKLSAFEVKRIELGIGGWIVTLYARLSTQDGDTVGPSIVTTVVVPEADQDIEDIISEATQMTLAANRRLARHDPNALATRAFTEQ